jgi:hypothetical protein
MSNSDLYNDLPTRLDTVVGNCCGVHYLHQKDFWTMVKRMVTEYGEVVAQSSTPYQYVLDTYGIKLSTDDVGNYLLTYEIVDEQKYLFGVLKHGGNC